jgi:hypothetical protein
MAEQVLMAKALFDRIASSGIALHNPPYAINLGCGDGVSYFDPVYPLFASGFTGLAVDGGNIPSLVDNLKCFPVTVRPATWIFPDNIVDILRSAGCPPNPEFLKIDIDGIDAPVMSELLRGGIRPLAIQMEVNPEIPPPFAFSICAKDGYHPGGQTGFFGCSLSYSADLLDRYDYGLIELDFTTEWTHDALFVHRSMFAWRIGIEELDPREAFLSQRPILSSLKTTPTDQKLAWRTRTDFAHVRDEIWTALMKACESKHGHTDVPFELYISQRRPIDELVVFDRFGNADTE